MLYLKSCLAPFRSHSDSFPKSMSTGLMVSERSPYLLCLPPRRPLVTFCRHLLLCVTSLTLCTVPVPVLKVKIRCCFYASQIPVWSTLLALSYQTCGCAFQQSPLCSKLDFPYRLFVSNIFVHKSVCMQRVSLKQNLKESAHFVCTTEFSSAIHPWEYENTTCQPH